MSVKPDSLSRLDRLSRGSPIPDDEPPPCGCKRACWSQRRRWVALGLVLAAAALLAVMGLYPGLLLAILTFRLGGAIRHHARIEHPNGTCPMTNVKCDCEGRCLLGTGDQELSPAR